MRSKRVWEIIGDCAKMQTYFAWFYITRRYVGPQILSWVDAEIEHDDAVVFVSETPQGSR
jgi:hypothetical protein